MSSAETELARVQAALIDAVDTVYRLRCELRGDTSSPVDNGLPTDLIEVGTAAELARRPKDSVRLWCRANPIDKPNGFSVRMRGKWLISRRPFLEFLRR